ncbi:hypothetical protein CANARDRAFT_29446 [[Candida] arabinofermentans NRRL YB-2248]|uniref:Uncharacterized protein n=1 Tax=[Candida] arabinofermentans NRRL YB-2248 TaxID=983967 RepID=A0A1E4SWU3_9ASCO|nr:hypothetical protein CANARDRAFT_29446 [[Candida] arabinofermentans NRRL YB-2248]
MVFGKRRKNRSAVAVNKRPRRSIKVEQPQQQQQDDFDHDDDNDYSNLDIKDDSDSDPDVDVDVDVDDDEDDDEDQDHQPHRARGRPKVKKVVKDEEDDDDEEEEEETTTTAAEPITHVNKKSKNNSNNNNNNVDLNDSIIIESDEVVTEIDPKGELKINSNGELSNGREFKCKTFTIKGRGDKLYMVATEAARFVGYRDSYFLFQKHKNLYKIIITDDEKIDLIKKGILPNSYRTRTIYLVAARSIFKEFGYKIVIKGRPIIDDYQEEKAKLLNESMIQNNEYQNEKQQHQQTPSSLQQQHQHQQQQLNTYQSKLVDNSLGLNSSESTWIYDHALKVRQFDSMLLYDRLEIYNKKSIKDHYTGINHVPDITQPTTYKILKLKNNDDEKEKKEQEKVIINGKKRKLIIDTVIKDDYFIKTGLSDVPIELFDGFVDNETKLAILQQQKLEMESI